MFRIMTAVCTVSVLLAVLFAALWVKQVYREEPVTPPADTEQNREALTALQEENETLREQLKAAEEAYDAVLMSVSADTQKNDEELTALQKEIETLREQLEAAETAHDAVSADTEEALSVYAPIEGTFDPGDLTPADPESLSYTFDLTKQYRVLASLENKLNEVPFIVTPNGTLLPLSKLTFPEGTTILYKETAGTGYDTDGKPLQREIDYIRMGYSFPTVAVSYLDLERGTSYSYNGDTVFFSASLIKAPYIYTLLDQFAQYNAVKAANPKNDPAVGQTLSPEIWEKYDLERKIRVTDKMKKDGSGSIRRMDLSGEGIEFTVLDLITYAIKESDNTAFSVLRNEFGYDYFWTVSKKLGCDSVFSSFNNMTAGDAVKYLAAIYDFAKAHPAEGNILISLMQNSAHSVMIPAALSGKNVAHKYGWDHDSYHDMALVYGDAPYAVCVMTNFDFPSNDGNINAYIQSLVRDVDALHESFYTK